MKCVTDIVLVADVSSYYELRFRLKRELVGFYFRYVMRFPVVEPAFLTLLKCATDMVLVADVSSYCKLSFARNGNLVGFYFRDVMQFPVP